MGSMSSSAISITSMPKRSRTIQRIQHRAQFGPRGVLKCFATATDTPGDDPRFGPWGKQRCEDTGPLTKKRSETIDEEFVQSTMQFISRAVQSSQPFFVWFNPVRMHILTY